MDYRDHPLYKDAAAKGKAKTASKAIVIAAFFFIIVWLIAYALSSTFAGTWNPAEYPLFARIVFFSWTVWTFFRIGFMTVDAVNDYHS